MLNVGSPPGKNRERGLAEILPWLVQLSPGVVLNKDGGFLACFSLRGLCAENHDPQVLDQAVEDLEQALHGLEGRCTLWCTVLRRPVVPFQPGCFSHEASRCIDRIYGEGLARHRHLANRHYLSVLWAAPKTGASLLQKAYLWVRSLGYGPVRTRAWEQVQQRQKQFEEILTQFMQAVPALGARRLEGTALLQFLQEMCSPSAPGDLPLAFPQGAYLDGALGEDEVVVGADHLRCTGIHGVRYGAALTLKAWPDHTFPGMLDSLLEVPASLTLSQVFRLVDQAQAQRYIKNVQRFHLNLQKSLFSYVREALSGEESVVRDTGRAVSAAEARQALTDMTAQRRLYGYVNVTLLVWSPTLDSLDEAVTQVAQAIRGEGFLVLRERLHLNSAWSGTLPGQWGELVRWHFISSSNWADLFALRTVPGGQRENPYLTRQRGVFSPALTVFRTRFGSPYAFNLHQQDLAHTFVVGPSRAGKSVWVNFVISQFQRYAPVHTVIFDKDRSCRIPVLLQGGRCFEVARQGMRLNPLKEIRDPAERLWLLGWLEGLLGARGHSLSSPEQQGLRQALEDLSLRAPELHRLRSLAGLLPRLLVEELEPWLGGGQWGGYFDHAEDDLQWASLTCFEMGEVLRHPVLARAFLDYAFHRIDQRLAQHSGIPTLIYIEEAWFMLADPFFAGRIRDWLKTLPKKMGFVILATQSLDDLSGSQIFATLADNVPTRIFLPNAQARVHRELYRNQFGLLESQIDLLARARPKRHYLLHTPGECVLLEATFEADLLAWLRSDVQAQRLFDRHVRIGARGVEGREAYFQALAQEEEGVKDS